MSSLSEKQTCIKKPEDVMYIKTSGSSMNPLIQEGDTLCLRRLEKENIEIGQVVLAYDGKHFFCHRVIDNIDGKYVLKGDNNLYIDGAFNKNKILGAVDMPLEQSSFAQDVKARLDFWRKIYFSGEAIKSTGSAHVRMDNMPFHIVEKRPVDADICIGIDGTSGTAFSKGLRDHSTTILKAKKIVVDFDLQESDPDKASKYSYCWNIENQYLNTSLNLTDKLYMILGMFSQYLSQEGEINHEKDTEAI